MSNFLNRVDDYIESRIVRIGAILAAPIAVFSILFWIDPDLGPHTILPFIMGLERRYHHQIEGAEALVLFCAATALLWHGARWIYRKLHRDVFALFKNSLFQDEMHAATFARKEFALLRKVGKHRLRLFGLRALRWPTFEQARIWTEMSLLFDGLLEERMQSNPGLAAMPKASQKISIFHDLAGFEKAAIRIKDKISLSNCQAVLDQQDKIIQYLSYIETVLAKHDKVPAAFLVPVEIKTGFLAPFFLMTGLYVTASEDWTLVINEFSDFLGKQSVFYKNLFPGSEKKYYDLAIYRLFQFNCWLVWGPSIAVCGCSEWRGHLSGLQFGFGDENNSLVVFTSQIRDELFRKKLDSLLRGGSQDVPAPAGKAAVQGRLMLPQSRKAELNHAQMMGLCQNTRETAAKRLGLQLEESQAGGAWIPKIGASDGKAGAYYSAYIWIMFIVCDSRTGGALYPLDPDYKNDPHKDMRWKNLLPFFVHGNIADPNSYLKYKRALVAQACATMKSLLREYQNITFSFVCAFDEPHCGGETYLHMNEQQSIRNLFRDEVRLSGPSTAPAVSLANRILVPAYDNAGTDHDNPYSSCQLPVIINAYYGQVEALRTRQPHG